MVWIWPRQNYRKTPGSLEAEAWAQFGREYFDNAPDVKEMFEELFPNLNSHAMMALKGMIWYVEELRDLSLQYANKFRGACPDEYEDIDYDDITYDEFVAFIRKCLRTGKEIPDIVD